MAFCRLGPIVALSAAGRPEDDPSGEPGKQRAAERPLSGAADPAADVAANKLFFVHRARLRQEYGVADARRIVAALTALFPGLLAGELFNGM